MMPMDETFSRLLPSESVIPPCGRAVSATSGYRIKACTEGRPFLCPLFQCSEFGFYTSVAGLLS